MDASKLSVLPGGNQEEDLSKMEPTKERLKQFITDHLKAEGSPLTCADVLTKPFLAGLKKTLTLAFQKYVEKINAEKDKKRRLAQAAADKLMAEEGQRLDAKLKKAIGLPAPLSQEEIRAKLMALVVAKVETKTQVQTGEELVRSRVLALRKELGDKLPAIAFESAGGAVEVRRIIKYCVQNLRAKRQEQGLEADYLANIQQLYDRIQQKEKGLFPMIDKVVVEGWGLELGKSSKQNQTFNEAVRIMSQDVRFAGMIKWVEKCPTPEEVAAYAQTDAELAKVREEAKANQAAAEAAEQQRQQKLRLVLKARLLEVAPELSDENVEQRAKFVARKYGHMVNIKDMFTAAANDCAALAKKNKEEQTAKVSIDLYIKAAYLTPEEFEVEFARFQNQQQRGEFIMEAVSPDNRPSGSVSPLGNKTQPNGRKQHQRRKAVKSARDTAIRDGMKGASGGSGRQKGGKKR